MEVFGKFLGVLGLLIVVSLLAALPVMWLWNWLMVDIFGLMTIGFWQAFGLKLLAASLFHSSSNSSD
jgi:cadmium resistance protein CadD (predicted permease)